MEEPQNTPPQPQEPKKSFWQKLFGGGHPAAPPASPPAPTSTDSLLPDDSPITTPDPVTLPQPTNSSVPANNWDDSSSNVAPVAPAEEASAPVSSAWPAPPAEVPSENIPAPPSDPMVTPVQADELPTPVNDNIPASTWSSTPPSEPQDPAVETPESQPPTPPPAQ